MSRRLWDRNTIHDSYCTTVWYVGYGVTANIAASHARVPRQLGVRFPVPEFFGSLSEFEEFVNFFPNKYGIMLLAKVHVPNQMNKKTDYECT